MNDSLTIRCSLPAPRRELRRRRLAAEASAPADPGRVPRVARLLALAHRLEGLVRDGVVPDYASLARLGRVSRARLSQILSLLLLAPDIQEEILFLPPVTQGRAPLHLALLLPIAAVPDWAAQRRHWHTLKRSLARSPFVP